MMGTLSTQCGLDKKTASILKALYYFNKNQRLAVLKSADRVIIRAICECILNIIEGRVKISEANRKKLGKYKNLLRKLASPQKKRSWRQRKEILVQKGAGIIPYLIQPLMSILLTKLLERDGSHS